jgi:DNA (cytosine-5)-methyltransferase 1
MGDLTAVGVSIYAGGHAVGVAGAGFRVLAHLEEGDSRGFGVATFRANFPDVPVAPTVREWPRYLPAQPVGWVYSNPPCAPWSQAGRTMRHGRDGWRSDPRVEHTTNSFAVLEHYLPTVWSWESVQRTYTVGADVVDDLTRRALGLGYAVTHFLTDWQLHGLPQRRARFFFVAHRVALTWPVPSAVPRTYVQATADLEDPGYVAPMASEWAEVASILAEGEYLRPRWERLTELPRGTVGPVVGRPPYTVHRIYADQVCSTVTSMRSQVHPAEARYLGTRELARVLGYPDDYVWVGHPGTHQAQMAKAVTPLAAAYLASVVRRGLERGATAEPRVRVVDFRPMVRERLAHLNRPLVRG